MPCRRAGDHWIYIFAKYKLLFIWAIENENKLVFRVIPADPFKILENKIAVPFQVIGQEKSGINGNYHNCKQV